MGMGQIVDYSQFILQIEKAIANGVASLDSNAKVPKNQISLNASDVGAIATGGTAGTANQLTAPRTISTTGDATYSVSFDGSTNVSSAITLANTGVAAGTYNALATQVRPFTVDAKGRITGVGTPVDIAPPWSAVTGKPTTLNGYGITDALNLAGGNVTGNLGLGVSLPTVKLSIGRLGGAFSVPTLNANTAALITAGGAATASGAFLSILGGNTSQVAVTFGDSDAAEQGGIYYNNSTDTLDLRAGNLTRISISSGTTTFSSATTSTSTTTGAIVTSSLGLTGNLHVGGLARVVSSAQFSGFVVSNGGFTVAQLQGSSVTNDVGTLTLRSAGVANVSISASGNSFLNGGNFGLGTNNPSYPLDVVGIGRITDQLLVTGTTPSTSTTTGAVVVSGGVGVGGAIFANSYNLIPIGRGAGNVSTNTAMGVNAGLANTTGYWNSFVGAGAGQSNTTGYANSFLGLNAGQSNTTGYANSFLGLNAGLSNTTGFNNSFVGVSAGRFIADGVTGLTVINNSCFFGMNTKGTENATNENVFGYNATGNGSNTVTIGDNSITNNFFRGALSLNATQVISTRRTGWAAPTGTATRTTFATETVTLPQLAERVKALIDDLTTHGLIGA